MSPLNSDIRIASRYSHDARAVVYEGDCLELLGAMPDGCMRLVVTSPPYNIGKEYESRTCLDAYVGWQSRVIGECVRVLGEGGHLCWQVGNYVDRGAIVPLDTLLYPVFTGLGLKMRNRIVWHFEHGLHCTRRLSGRYETICWFTKGDEYYFNVDPIRVPQKYPGKLHFKGEKAGLPSANPLGKNPGDVWIFPNVKSNHVEKTSHPCQFPVELVERLILSMTVEGDTVLDPFLGTGTTVAAAVLNGRRGVGAEVAPEYCAIARERVEQAAVGMLRFRPRTRPVYDPRNAGAKITTAPWKTEQPCSSGALFEPARNCP